MFVNESHIVMVCYLFYLLFHPFVQLAYHNKNALNHLGGYTCIISIRQKMFPLCIFYKLQHRSYNIKNVSISSLYPQPSHTSRLDLKKW